MLLRFFATAVCVIAMAGLAGAQTHENPFRFGTALSGFAGGAADNEGTAAAAGLELGWEITRRLAVQGNTLWTAPGNGQHDFAVMLGPKINLKRTGRSVPFVTAGIGMYRATFDSLAGPLPPFYGDRLTPAQRLDTGGSFDDFVAAIGGGADVFVHAHWAVRPDVRVMMVVGNADVRWLTAFGGSVAYHFERHQASE